MSELQPTDTVQPTQLEPPSHMQLRGERGSSAYMKLAVVALAFGTIVGAAKGFEDRTSTHTTINLQEGTISDLTNLHEIIYAGATVDTASQAKKLAHICAPLVGCKDIWGTGPEETVVGPMNVLISEDPDQMKWQLDKDTKTARIELPAKAVKFRINPGRLDYSNQRGIFTLFNSTVVDLMGSIHSNRVTDSRNESDSALINQAIDGNESEAWACIPKAMEIFGNGRLKQANISDFRSWMARSGTSLKGYEITYVGPDMDDLQEQKPKDVYKSLIDDHKKKNNVSITHKSDGCDVGSGVRAKASQLLAKGDAE